MNASSGHLTALVTLNLLRGVTGQRVEQDKIHAAM